MGPKGSVIFDLPADYALLIEGRDCPRLRMQNCRFWMASGGRR